MGEREKQVHRDVKMIHLLQGLVILGAPQASSPTQGLFVMFCTALYHPSHSSLRILSHQSSRQWQRFFWKILSGGKAWKLVNVSIQPAIFFPVCLLGLEEVGFLFQSFSHQHNAEPSSLGSFLSPPPHSPYSFFSVHRLGFCCCSGHS
jgi:hypothetical protein